MTMVEQTITSRKRDSRKFEEGNDCPAGSASNAPHTESPRTTTTQATIIPGAKGETHTRNDVAQQSTLNAALLPHWLPGTALDALQSAEAVLVPVQPLLELSERLEWRVCRYYRDICFLFAQKDSQQKGYVFAESLWYQKKYDCNPATLRRWQAILIKNGWLASVGKGPQRRLIPLLHPRKVLVFFTRFARLFAGVLRGFWGRLLISTEKEKNSNRENRRLESGKKPDSPPVLSGREIAAVVLLRQKGIGTDSQAQSLVKTYGADRCLEQIEALPYRKSSSPGAMLSMAIRENYPAPPELISKREEKNRREEEREKNQELLRKREAEKARRSAEASVRALEVAERLEAERVERLSSAPAELIPLWNRALERLRETVTGPSFATHIASLVPVSREGDRITLRALSGFARDWALRRHREALTSALCVACGDSVEIEIK